MSKKKHSGLTLIELMIAMLIGLLLLGGILHVFTGSRQASRTNEALSRVQESGRFALEFLAYDIRQAGYKGTCFQVVTNHLNLANLPANHDGALYDLDDAIRGWDDAAGAYAQLLTHYVANTDVLRLSHAVTATDAIPKSQSNQSLTSNSINLESASTLQSGTIVLVTNPEGCDLFQTQPSPQGTVLNKPSSQLIPGNVNPGGAVWSTLHGSESEILGFRSYIYYVGRNVNGPSEVPSLYRVRVGAGAEELVEGVLNMQIQYGVDATGNQRVDRYDSATQVTTDGNWSNVVAVRVSLLVVSNERNVTVEPQTIRFNGADVIVPANRLAQVFTTTVGVRNRLP